MPKMSNYYTIALISHTSKVILKNLQAGFNSILTDNSQMFNLDLEKAEEPEIKLPNPLTIEKAREFQKTPISASLTMLKPLTEWITTNCGKFLKRWK